MKMLNLRVTAKLLEANISPYLKYQMKKILTYLPSDEKSMELITIVTTNSFIDLDKFLSDNEKDLFISDFINLIMLMAFEYLPFVDAVEVVDSVRYIITTDVAHELIARIMEK